MDIAGRRFERVPLWLQSAAFVVLLAAIGLAVGQLTLTAGITKTLGIICASALIVLLLRTLWIAIGLVLTIICLFPFGVLPLSDTAVTPSFLELSILAAITVYAAILLIDRTESIRTGGPQTIWLAMIGTIVFAFVLGLGRGYTTQTLHDFFKFLLALTLFAIAVQALRTFADVELLITLLAFFVSLASIVALALYAAGSSVTERVLLRAVAYGYPSFRIVRYIEDDPSRPMRAIGTAVDPNAFGGLMMIGFVIAVSQLIVRNRFISLPLATSSGVLTGVAMLLTYSRGAWVGAAVGTSLILLLRRPLLLIPVFAGGIGFIALGIGVGFTERLWLGFTFQDPATRLRLREYENAWNIIREHPWFGVGFGEAPSLDLQTGVSSIYLTAAEQAGLVGLMMFLIVVGTILWRSVYDAAHFRDNRSDDLLLTVVAVFVSMLTVGLVDHYFFNITFAHMVATFWLIAGTLVAITSLRREQRIRRAGHVNKIT